MPSASIMTLVASLPTLFFSGLALWYYNYYYSSQWRKKEEEEDKPQAPAARNEVLFFPDEATARSLSYTQPQEEKNLSKISPGSLSVLIGTLQEAKKTLDVCVFVLTCKELADVLVNAHQNGVEVRVISDNEQSFASGSQVERLRKVGIQVRNDGSSYFMHHKFAVVDDRLLVSGSLNWTLQGVCGNQENVIVTTVPELVTPFGRQFEKLWEMYDPERMEYYVQSRTGVLSSVN